MINEMKDLLPVGSIVLLKGGVKKTVIIGVLQVSEENPEEMYDYIGVPYPEGYLGEDNACLFQQENINDVIFRGYENPEREEMLKLFDIVLESAREQLK